MRTSGLFLCSAVSCLVLVLPARAQTQAEIPTEARTPKQPHEEAIYNYSKEYVRTAGDNTALFSGRVPSPLAGNIESMYLRDRGSIERDSYGDEIFPLPVDPLASYAVGDIFYDGVLYVGVRMRLDLYRDEVEVASPGSSFYGSLLDRSLFGYADVRGYRIIHLPASHDDLPEGYYLKLNEGLHTVLKKEHFQFDPSYMKFNGRTIRYYIEKDGVYHRVGRRRGPILRLLRDQRSELARYIRSARLNLRNDTERVLPLIVGEYERLNNR